jgi:MtrB/PioB family decaheme-associated outer membrane protein
MPSTATARIGPGLIALIALAALVGGRASAAEAAGSGLDDEGLEASREIDERGLSALTPTRRRSPSGLLYPYPYESPKWTSLGALDWRGFAELGYLGNADRDDETRFYEHVDWSDGLLLRDFFLDARSRDGGRYAHFEGGAAGRDDAFYRAEVGRRGWLRLGLFYDEVPHVLANDARSLYGGIGSERLSLPPPLVPGGSSLADIDTALSGIGERQLEIERDRAGGSLSLRATPELTLSGHYRRERRTGERPFGGAIFFSFPFPGGNNGSVIETVEPIDSLTHTFGGGLQYAARNLQANLAYRGSTFENQRASLVWENPFTMLGPQVPEGRAALAPDNLAHGVHGDLALVLPWQGRWTASAAWNRMSQSEGLFPSTINPAFADWTTAASLRDREADALVETWLFDSSLRLRPWRPLTARVHLRWFERDDHTDYDAFNPLANDYGYVAEDGRFGVIPRYAPVPFDHTRILGEGSLLWRTPWGANLELEYAREAVERSHRARDTREDIGRASLTSRRLGPATLRLAYELRDRRGGRYDVAHDALYYSQGPLDGFADPPLGTPLQSLREFRQVDLASRFQHELQARLHLALGRAVDLSLAGLVRNADFDSDYGRDFERARELNLEVGWQPSPRLDLHAFGSVEKRISRLASIDAADGVVPVPPLTAGSATFPLANAWTADSDGSTLGFGTGFRARPVPRLELSGDYSWLRSRDLLDYAFASDGALAAATTAAEAGSGLPRLRSRAQVLRLATEIELSERWSARFFYRFEHSRLQDPQQRALVPRIRHTLYLGHVDDDFKATILGGALRLRF